jgi:hypothetical protein
MLFYLTEMFESYEINKQIEVRDKSLYNFKVNFAVVFVKYRYISALSKISYMSSNLKL